VSQTIPQFYERHPDQRASRGVGISDYRPSGAWRKELVAGSIPYHSRADSNLSQLAHVNELPEIWPELRVVAETLAVIEDLIFGRCAPDSAHNELSVSVYSVRSWHQCKKLASDDKLLER
jgi:hypothetical protein